MPACNYYKASYCTCFNHLPLCAHVSFFFSYEKIKKAILCHAELSPVSSELRLAVGTGVLVHAEERSAPRKAAEAPRDAEQDAAMLLLLLLFS